MGKAIGDSLRKPVRGRLDGEAQNAECARRSSAGLSFGRGFDSPRLHQIIYHLLIKRILSMGGFYFALKSWDIRRPRVLAEWFLLSCSS